MQERKDAIQLVERINGRKELRERRAFNRDLRAGGKCNDLLTKNEGTWIVKQPADFGFGRAKLRQVVDIEDGYWNIEGSKNMNKIYPLYCSEMTTNLTCTDVTGVQNYVLFWSYKKWPTQFHIQRHPKLEQKWRVVVVRKDTNIPTILPQLYDNVKLKIGESTYTVNNVQHLTKRPFHAERLETTFELNDSDVSPPLDSDNNVHLATQISDIQLTLPQGWETTIQQQGTITRLVRETFIKRKWMQSVPRIFGDTVNHPYGIHTMYFASKSPLEGRLTLREITAQTAQNMFNYSQLQKDGIGIALIHALVFSGLMVAFPPAALLTIASHATQAINNDLLLESSDDTTTVTA